MFKINSLAMFSKSVFYFVGRQVFYLIDESENTGKGANSVISMVHHFFQYHGYGEKTASIHFDNCSGQNKNNFVLWYALWRVLVGKFHREVHIY